MTRTGKSFASMPMADWLKGMEGSVWTWHDTDRVLRHIREVEESWRKLDQHRLGVVLERPDSSAQASAGVAATAMEDAGPHLASGDCATGDVVRTGAEARARSIVEVAGYGNHRDWLDYEAGEVLR